MEKQACDSRSFWVHREKNLNDTSSAGDVYTMHVAQKTVSLKNEVEGIGRVCAFVDGVEGACEPFLEPFERVCALRKPSDFPEFFTVGGHFGVEGFQITAWVAQGAADGGLGLAGAGEECGEKYNSPNHLLAQGFLMELPRHGVTNSDSNEGLVVHVGFHERRRREFREPVRSSGERHGLDHYGSSGFRPVWRLVGFLPDATPFSV